VDSLNESMAKGKVFPAKTLGGDTQVLHGFSTVHGYTFKGDSIYGEDWVDVGQLYIIVRGTTPGTLSNSFLSTNQLEFEAITRSHSGNTVTPSNNSIIWGTIALNDTSGFLSPDSGRGRIFYSIPNPKNAPYTRGEALAYKCSCSVNYSGVGAQDWVVLRQDERDQLIQEYIDTQKARTPARSEFVFSVGSYAFADEDLRSSDYNCFIFSDTLLSALVQTGFEYGHTLSVYEHNGINRGYSSPNRLFLTKPQGGIGPPSYWENASESLHLYGYAADIQVLDLNANGRYRDDWDSLAVIMINNGINPVDMGDSTYIHAIVEFIRQEKVHVAFDRDEVAPGCEERYSRTLPEIVRRINISGSLDSTLSPYIGSLDLSVVELALSGGHNHSGRPIRRFPIPSQVTQFGTSGTFGNVLYSDLCLWGGEIAVHAFYSTANGIYQGSDTLMIRFPNMTSLGFTPDLVDGGSTPAHPDNHYLYGPYEDRIQEIAEYFNTLIQQQYPDSGRRQIYVNDNSLVNGGQFDVGPRPGNLGWRFWQWPHQLHRDGCTVDLSFLHFSRQHPFHRLLYDAIVAVTSIQPDTSYSGHIHARLGWREWPRE